MAATPTLALDAQAILGECPRWHPQEQRLYWVDIEARELHRFDPVTGADDARTLPEVCGCFAFCRSGGLLLAIENGFATMSDWDAPLVPFGDAPLEGKPDLRFNDGRTDCAGNFWAGSVNFAKSASDAALYRLNPHGECTEIEGGMLTSNGAAFSADGGRFMHTDTPSHTLRAYDVVGGELVNMRPFHAFPHGKGRPDGGSFDEAGFYWSALFDGGKLVRLSPDGEIVQEIELPVSRPTMIAFGGADRCTAYVTSARKGLDETVLKREPHAGGIFSFRVDVPGVAEHPFG